MMEDEMFVCILAVGELYLVLGNFSRNAVAQH